MSAGKGDKLRAGANLKKYWDNYDVIFAKKKTILEWQKQFDCANMNINNSNSPLDEAITLEQFKQLMQCKSNTQTES